MSMSWPPVILAENKIRVMLTLVAGKVSVAEAACEEKR